MINPGVDISGNHGISTTSDLLTGKIDVILIFAGGGLCPPALMGSRSRLEREDAPRQIYLPSMPACDVTVPIPLTLESRLRNVWYGPEDA